MKKYSLLTGAYHYLPGKFEMFLVGLVFVPVWVIHFIYSTNLNELTEVKTLAQKDEEEETGLRRNSKEFTDRAKNSFTIHLEQEDQPFFMRKRVVIERTWSQISYSKKILRNVIIFVPMLIFIFINTFLQYLVAGLVDQGNFNLLNVSANIFTVYLLIFHFTVFVPLMFYRSKIIIKGDYLWNPAYTIIIEYKPDLDMEEIELAIKQYNQAYLENLAKGEDLDNPNDGFEVDNRNKFWNKSKLADLANQDRDDVYLSGYSPKKSFRDEDNNRGNAFKVKYTTFDEKGGELKLGNVGVISNNSDLTPTDKTKSDRNTWTTGTEITGISVPKKDLNLTLNPIINTQNIREGIYFIFITQTLKNLETSS